MVPRGWRGGGREKLVGLEFQLELNKMLWRQRVLVMVAQQRMYFMPLHARLVLCIFCHNKQCLLGPWPVFPADDAARRYTTRVRVSQDKTPPRLSSQRDPGIPRYMSHLQTHLSHITQKGELGLQRTGRLGIYRRGAAWVLGPALTSCVTLDKSTHL